MQIILQEDVEKLGTRGQVVEVAAGYARNFLLPRKLAIAATPGNLKRLEKIRSVLDKRTATEREGAQKQADVLAAASVTLADIAEALAAQGYQVDKRKIELREPIKLIGEYQVTAKLHHDVTATIKVVVQREG